LLANCVQFIESDALTAMAACYLLHAVRIGGDILLRNVDRLERHNLNTTSVYSTVVAVVRPPLWSSGQSSGHTTEMYCVSCEVRTEFIYVM
jgi:hypothetical protein